MVMLYKRQLLTRPKLYLRFIRGKNGTKWANNWCNKDMCLSSFCARVSVCVGGGVVEWEGVVYTSWMVWMVRLLRDTEQYLLRTCFYFLLSLKTYINCACITARFVGDHDNPELADDVAAIHGECKKPCSMFIPYLVSYFVIMFLGPMCANPATLLKLRYVLFRNPSSFW